MGTETIGKVEYKKLTEKYDNEPISFYHHQLDVAKDYRLTHNDNLPDIKFWNYLEVRRSIDPIRFDKYHPVVGKWISEVPTVSMLPPGSSVVVPPNVPPVKQLGAPGGIPEPSTGIMLAMGMIFVGMILSIKR